MEGDRARLAIWLTAPSLDGLRTAAVGGFACDDAEAGARLLRQTCDDLFAEGVQAVLGPMDGDTWGAHRLVIESDGRPPFALEPRNPPHHVAAFEGAGFTPVARYLSAERPTAPCALRPAPPGVTVRTFDPTRADTELRAMHALSLRAFAGNAYYVPIDAERFLAAYTPILPHLDPELVLMAEDEAGALKGFLFGLPDLEQGPKPTAAILKTYASEARGLGGALADRFHNTAAAKGYATVIHALMHETNVSAERSRDLRARVFRRYALYGRRL